MLVAMAAALAVAMLVWVGFVVMAVAMIVPVGRMMIVMLVMVYALRRAALGVIRLVLENEVRLRLRKQIESAAWIPVEQWSDGMALVASKATEVLVDDEPSELRKWLAVHNRADASELPFEIDRIFLQHGTISDDQSELADRGEATWLAIFASREFLSPARVGNDLLAFFADRLKVLLRDQGKRHDLVDAVFALGDDDLVRIVRRVEALDGFLATDDGANLLAGYKRASNILKAEEKKGAVPTGMVQTGLPGQPEQESALAFAAAAAATAVDAALETEDFAAAMTALSRLRAPVDAFFDKVMVNSDVAAERDNRLKLLGQVRSVMGRVADFGMVGG